MSFKFFYQLLNSFWIIIYYIGYSRIMHGRLCISPCGVLNNILKETDLWQTYMEVDV